MDKRTAALVSAEGGDPDGFEARQLTPEMVASADLVLTATRRHRAVVVTLCPAALRCAFTFRDFAALASEITGGDRLTGPADADALQAVVRRVAARRGMNPPLPVEEADIVDPFRQGDEVFTRMVNQVRDSLPRVLAALTP